MVVFQLHQILEVPGLVTDESLVFWLDFIEHFGLIVRLGVPVVVSAELEELDLLFSDLH